MSVVVIDTNVWISAFVNPAGFPARLLQAGLTGKLSVVSSLPLLDELHEVLMRPRIRRLRETSDAEVEEFVAAVAAIARLVPVTGELRLCRDPDDDALLETAVRGKAQYVISRDEDVTRDPDLVAGLAEQGVEAITVRRFLEQQAQA